jgi:hypothetical protein
MVLDYDVGLNQVEEMSSKALVSCFTTKVLKGVTLKQWMNIGW